MSEILSGSRENDINLSEPASQVLASALFEVVDTLRAHQGEVLDPALLASLSSLVLGLSTHEASVPELAGVSEAAAILGVSRQRVHQLARRHDAIPSFPIPVARVKATPLWTRASIQSYAEQRRTTPGPRPN